jgi:hypothetical protein
MIKIMLMSSLLLSLANAYYYTPKKLDAYVGIGYGATAFNANYNRVDLYNSSISKNGYANDMGYKLYAGLQATDTFGVEVSYNSYGKFTNLTYIQEPKSITLSATFSESYYNQQFRPFVNIGIGYMHTKQNLNFYFKHAFVLHYGLGIDYFHKALNGLGLRIALEGDNSVESDNYYDVYSYTKSFRNYVNYHIGVIYKF